MNDYRDYIMHYGVKGMHWGVRRYQNYDGTYTQRGLKRFRESEEKYNDAKSKYNEAKKNKDHYEAAKYKSQMKTHKKDLNKIYKNLKTDKLADQGKDLYKSGKTITDNKAALSTFRTVMGAGFAASTVFSYTNAGKRTVNTRFGNIPIGYLAPAAIALTEAAVEVPFAIKNHYQNKRLRAYYAH